MIIRLGCLDILRNMKKPLVFVHVHYNIQILL